MPSATPLPRGPSHLALFGAEDLLRGPGCPVCRYVAEAGDRFLGWFALEAHAEASMITRLCRSLGLCPVHTRALLRQPGADGRMTAVYRYLLRAAAQHLADGTSPSGPCLGCARDSEAAQRAVDTLLTGLQDVDLRERYRDVGGLCLPHLRAAVPRAGRRLAAWLAGQAAARLAKGSPDPAAIIGDHDADTGVRARLRGVLPAAMPPAAALPYGICAVCLGAALTDRDALARVATTAPRPAHDKTRAGLCPVHLQDACSSLEDRRVGVVTTERILAEESERAAVWLAELASPPKLRGAFRKPAGQPRGRSGNQCPACEAAGAAEASLLTAIAGPSRPPGLCLRHVIALRRRDPRSAEPVVRAAGHATQVVLGEIEEALRKRTWAFRHEPRGREMTAWQRAAALMDGRVYGGGPPGPL
jgi:hypothetical protein